MDRLNDPFFISVICWIFVGLYYVLSARFIKAAQVERYSGPWSRNGIIDVGTSILWCLTACLLIASLLDLTRRNELTVGYLIQYYIFFLFLFGFIYNILDWHWPGMLKEAGTGWPAELQCIIVSIRSMTTLGYSNAKPGHAVTDLICSLQVLLGLFFVAVFIAKAVGRG